MLHFNLLKAETAADAARLAADRFQEVICAKPACVLGLATGSIPMASIRAV